jgi:hypothetical protein
MADESYPTDLRYHQAHGWARVEADAATFGITWYAQDTPQEVTNFDAPQVGDRVAPKRTPWSRGDVPVRTISQVNRRESRCLDVVIDPDRGQQAADAALIDP